MSKKISIGRDSRCDIRIDECYDTVSNFHAEIEFDDEQIVYIDKSTNGTVINKQKIHSRSVEIFQGDQICLAGVYTLPWEELNRYLPRRSRPTAHRNIHSDPTVPLDKGTIRRGRETENMASKQFDVSQSRYSERNQKESSYELNETLRHWNWGAFFWGWIWGIAHKTYWPLLQIVIGIIPFLGWIGDIIIRVYLGLNGSKIAWQSGVYRSLDSMKDAQHKWAIWGLLWFFIQIAIGIWGAISFLSIVSGSSW